MGALNGRNLIIVWVSSSLVEVIVTHLIVLVFAHLRRPFTDDPQGSNRRMRWHDQFDHRWNMSGALRAQAPVVYVGRVSRLCSRSCQGASDTGSVDALKASDGTLLWHHPIDLHNDLGQSVQVMKVIDGVVYVGVGVFPLGSQSGGDVYALRANT